MRINLLPADKSFLPLFQQQSDVLRDASRLLVEEARSGEQNASSAAAQVRELEHRGDALIRDILQRANTAFVTALEPEDIRLLASRLDDVLDAIEEVAHRIAAYHVPELPAPAVRLCDIVEGCVRLIGEVIAALIRRAEILEPCVKINRLEEEADHLMRAGIAELMRNNGDAIAVLKLKEIYELLECAVDRCEDVADVLQSIAAKSS